MAFLIPLLDGGTEYFVPGTKGPFTADRPRMGGYFTFEGWAFRQRVGLWDRQNVLNVGENVLQTYQPDSRRDSYVLHLPQESPLLGEPKLNK